MTDIMLTYQIKRYSYKLTKFSREKIMSMVWMPTTIKNTMSTVATNFDNESLATAGSTYP